MWPSSHYKTSLADLFYAYKFFINNQISPLSETTHNRSSEGKITQNTYQHLNLSDV